MKKIIILISAVFLVSGVNAQQERKLIRQGNSSYHDQKFTDAEESYRKALEIKPQSTEANYNVGNVLYKQKKYLDAAAKYSSVLNSVKDKKEQANIYYNLGNSYLMANKLDESIKAYKQSLKLNPEDRETKFNLAYAQRMLLQQQQQQNKQNDKNNKDDKQKNQNKDQNNDQKNKDQQNKKDDQQQNKKQDQQKNISQEDANRILEAMQNEEKELQKKLKMEKVQKEKGKTLKNW